MAISDSDHVMRHVSYNRLIKDSEGNICDSDGKFFGLFPQAFELRELAEGEFEKGLSVNWLEFFGNDHQANTQSSIDVFRATRKINRGAKCCFAIGNVKKIKEVCEEAGSRRIKILHKPIKDNEAYAEIRHLPKNDQDVMSRLASDAFLELIANAKLP